MSRDQVALMAIDRYDVDLIALKLERAFALAGILLPRDSKVLLKPNVVSQNTPRQSTGTHPAVIDALCRLLSDNGNAITIGESSAFYQDGHTLRGLQVSGIAAVAKKHGARTIAFEREPIFLGNAPDNRVLKEILMPTELRETDCLVSVAKLKTHSFFEFSGAVKNLFGLVPGGAKFEYHYKGGFGQALFGQKLADIWNMAKPAFCVIDGIVGLEGFGPAATGTPKRSGWLFASKNCWAADWVAATCAGFDPGTLDGAKAGMERGFLVSPDAIDVKGDFASLPIDPYRRAPVAPEKSKETNPIYKLVAVRPSIKDSRCDGCGVCVPECPLGALKENSEGKVSLNPEICLSCLHCVYVCPRRAIAINGISPWHMAARALRRIIRI